MLSVASLLSQLSLLSPVSDLALALWILFAIAVASAAPDKQRSRLVWLLLALLAGPVALLALACVGGAGIPCHQCRERIRPRARTCDFCGVARCEPRPPAERALRFVVARLRDIDTRSPVDLRGAAAVLVAVLLSAVAVLATTSDPVSSNGRGRPAARAGLRSGG